MLSDDPIKDIEWKIRAAIENEDNDLALELSIGLQQFKELYDTRRSKIRR